MSDKKWEEVTVDPKGAGHTYRLRVPGGYLYRTVTYRYPEKHAQWDVLVKETGSVRDALLVLNTMDPRKGFTREWQSQAQEIAAQTSVFVPKASKREHLTAKKAAKASAKVRKTFQDYYDGLKAKAQSIVDTPKNNVVKLDEYRSGDVVEHKPELRNWRGLWGQF